MPSKHDYLGILNKYILKKERYKFKWVDPPFSTRQIHIVCERRTRIKTKNPGGKFG